VLVAHLVECKKMKRIFAKNLFLFDEWNEKGSFAVIGPQQVFRRIIKLLEQFPRPRRSIGDKIGKK